MNPDRGANTQPFGKAGVSSGFPPSHASRVDTSKSWESFSAPPQDKLNQSSFSLPLDVTSQCNKELASLSKPLVDQGRPSSLAPGAQMAAKAIEVPGPTPILPLIQATNEIFPSTVRRKSGTMVSKGRKNNKEKLKVVLVAIDRFEDEDMEEATSDLPGTQQDPSFVNPGRRYVLVNDGSLQRFMSLIARDKFSFPEYDSDDSASFNYGGSLASIGPPDSLDLSELRDNIFRWDSYDSFAQFCSKIGINL